MKIEVLNMEVRNFNKKYNMKPIIDLMDKSIEKLKKIIKH